MMKYLKDILRPFFGLVFVQPLVLLWFYFMSDDWKSDYHSLGWTLQITITIYLIPIYAFYERAINKVKGL